MEASFGGKKRSIFSDVSDLEKFGFFTESQLLVAVALPRQNSTLISGASKRQLEEAPQSHSDYKNISNDISEERIYAETRLRQRKCALRQLEPEHRCIDEQRGCCISVLVCPRYVPDVSHSCHSEDTASPAALLLREAARDNNLNTCRISAWVC